MLTICHTFLDGFWATNQVKESNQQKWTENFPKKSFMIGAPSQAAKSPFATHSQNLLTTSRTFEQNIRIFAFLFRIYTNLQQKRKIDNEKYEKKTALFRKVFEERCAKFRNGAY